MNTSYQLYEYKGLLQFTVTLYHSHLSTISNLSIVNDVCMHVHSVTLHTRMRAHKHNATQIHIASVCVCVCLLSILHVQYDDT